MFFCGNPGHKDVQRMVEDVLMRSVKAGRAAGVLTADEALAKRHLELGATFVAVGTDVGLLSRATLYTNRSVGGLRVPFGHSCRPPHPS